jgi:mannose-6-phosphate isomerase-like protein (cupin superfamily)
VPVTLEGGCLVSELNEGAPAYDGALRIWSHIDEEHGAKAISLRMLELNGSATLHNALHDEVLYVFEGHGRVLGEDLRADTGIYLPRGAAVTIEGAMTLISSRCPAEAGEREVRVTTMESRPIEQTGDRWYREIITEEVTQFVGAIPPGRAPDHYHLYEEVLCILDGHGTMWAGETSTPIARGSCIFLPRKQIHCIENRGDRELRLLGVFYPAGSPAVRYATT